MATNTSWKVPRKENKTEDQISNSNASGLVPGKRKRTGPFRIQKGCVVSLRLRPQHLKDCRISVIKCSAEGREALTAPPEPQSIFWDDNFTFVWTKPCVGRDEGLALIGKRIRCVFPRNNDDSKSKKKVLEGEIIRLVDYGDEQLRGTKKGFTAELLIEKKESDLFSFLEHGCEGWATGEKGMRNQDLEERIRGNNTVSVMVHLMKPLWMDFDADSGSNPGKKYVRWAVAKLVPAKLFYRSAPLIPKSDFSSVEIEKPFKEPRKSKGVISTGSRYLGDGNDPADQQIANFKWVARRYHEILFSSIKDDQANDLYTAEMLSAGFCAKVVKVEPTSDPLNGIHTIAMVTLERIFLPEHTYSGRLSHDYALSAYHDHAPFEGGGKNLLQVPIEHLIIIGKKLIMEQTIPEDQQSDPRDVLAALIVSYSYSQNDDFYVPISDAGDLPLQSRSPCHRCRRIFPRSSPRGGCSQIAGKDSWLCESCSGSLCAIRKSFIPDVENCDCRRCAQNRSSGWESDIRQSINTLNEESPAMSFFSRVCHSIGYLGTVDFQPPIMTASAVPVPFVTASTKTRLKGPTRERRSSVEKPLRECSTKVGSEQKKKKKRRGETLHDAENEGVETQEDFSVFQPTCARFIAYDSNRKRRKGTRELTELKNDKPRNLREKEVEKSVGEVERDEKYTSGRAARANQRRVLKDVASFGASNALSIDTLACREPQLRFDRSSIHAWGVFADEDIAAGEMILEYRGEIIGNSIAEKRELEYEAAKIGSDYMFRIDATTVCDATKQGCVARFINASCGPNCYTKIITLDGNKRIVIYAKRNIRAGEELCYDYKFPLEFDESKRIPCYCGAKECRGYMNWDKKYVAVPPPSKVEPTSQNTVKQSK